MSATIEQIENLFKKSDGKSSELIGELDKKLTKQVSELSTTMDGRFTEVNKSLANVTISVSAVSDRVGVLEKADKNVDQAWWLGLAGTTLALVTAVVGMVTGKASTQNTSLPPANGSI